MPDENFKRYFRNWSLPERELLLGLVEERKHFFDNRRIGGAIFQAKVIQRNKVTRENSKFCNDNKTKAIKASPKGQWQRIKKKGKKDKTLSKSVVHLANVRNEEVLRAKISSILNVDPGSGADGIYNVLSYDSYRYAGGPAVPRDSHGSNEEVLERSSSEEMEKDIKNHNYINASSDEDSEKDDKCASPSRLPIQSSSKLRRRKKMEALELQTQLAIEELGKKQLILNKEFEIKSEILRQEKIKTKMLLLELKLKKS